MDTEPLEPITLYRGIALRDHPELRHLRFVDDHVHYIFRHTHPGLTSEVARRYNAEEARRRFEAVTDAGRLQEMMMDHYLGNREFSFFVAATEREEEAAFFAAGTGRHEWGLVARIRRGEGFTRFEPLVTDGRYNETLVIGQVQPEEIDKVTLLGARGDDAYVIHYIYRREDDGEIRKYKPFDPGRFLSMRQYAWNAEHQFQKIG